MRKQFEIMTIIIILYTFNNLPAVIFQVKMLNLNQSTKTIYINIAITQRHPHTLYDVLNIYTYNQ